MSPKPDLFLIKRDIGKRLTGVKDSSAPEQGLLLTNLGRNGAISRCDLHCQHFQQHQDMQTTQGEEGLALDWV